MWLQHKEVVDLVESTWKTWIFGMLVYIWEKNIFMVKQDLKHWAKLHFVHPSSKKLQIKSKLA
jgi:hypothetical protein